MRNMAYNFRTDMADERVDEYKKVHNLSDISGIKVENKENDFLKITTVDVLNDNGKQALGKDIGKYVTIEIENAEFLTNEQKSELEKEISNQIKNMLDKKYISAMIVGLGNEYVTPDSLGPKVISYINVTRHVIKYAKNLVKSDTMEISAISPGVLGMTGIETEEIIEAIVERVKPEIIIVIDSLASRSITRLGNTIQLGNTGITPGAGIGNKRKALNKENLGVPVIAIGVPTVVSVATITNEAIDKLLENVDNNDNGSNNKVIDILKSEDRYNRILDILNTENYIVTPKEIDNIINKISEIIANGINDSV